MGVEKIKFDDRKIKIGFRKIPRIILRSFKVDIQYTIAIGANFICCSRIKDFTVRVF